MFLVLPPGVERILVGALASLAVPPSLSIEPPRPDETAISQPELPALTRFAADLAVGQLATLDFDAPVLRFHPAVVRLRDRTLAPAALRFLEIVRALEAELPGDEAVSSSAAAGLSEAHLEPSA